AAGTVPAAGELRYEPGCLKKLLLSALTLRFVERGELDLDAAIGTHLSELAGTEKGDAIKLWHLLSNTTGYGVMTRRNAGDGDFAALVSFVRTSEQLF